MLFNSLEFLFFLPVVFIIYWFVCKTKKQQNILVVIASYVFYGWWDWRFLLLIAFTSLCSYASGIAISQYEDDRKKQKKVSAANIIVNLLILAIFKYYNFFAESFAELFRSIGYQMDVASLNIILPVGISFYTFQALSYSIDVYQNKIKPTSDIIQFFAYISFFPQLVAGPIERATSLLPQFNHKRFFDYTQTLDGLRQMLWGFFKKVLVADMCAHVVNENWGDYQTLPSLMILQVAFFFSIQIYCDFSGYSDIAIGCGKIFGVKLMRNFKVPYFSRNIAEFWRRWHVSLMTWFRDYLYFPLGGSRCSQWKVARNTLIVFLISGLWHGANWTFVVWGGYNSLLLIIGNFIRCNTKYADVIADNSILPTIKEIGKMICTFILVTIGWIIFRSESMEETCNIFHAISENPFYNDDFVLKQVQILAVVFLFVVEWVERKKDYALQAPYSGWLKYKACRWLFYYALFLSVYGYWDNGQDFVYFQF